MKALFKELPPFERARGRYLDDDSFRGLQDLLLSHPTSGAVIEGTGGLRKMRFPDSRRGKGTRGGIRIIYYWWQPGQQFWLFSVYGKDETADLSHREKSILKHLLLRELEERQ